jgi:tRNA dimethylallyltransferase
MNPYQLITILGPTASGKTTLAAALANRLETEIISADSRQVYRCMDIGTGKDLADYIIAGKQIPYHLIDSCEAGEKYNVFEFQHDFHDAFTDITRREKLPILCGGTGLYIEAVLKGYKLPAVPEDKELRHRLASKSLPELREMLLQFEMQPDNTVPDSVKRAIRAIEVATHARQNTLQFNEFKPIDSLIVGIDLDRDIRRQKITNRLKARLDEGMMDEIKSLLDKGISPEDLIYYGLEYKFVTQHLLGELTYAEMFAQLEIAIHQFAKRQMTWFRGMERRGFNITWIDANCPLNEKMEKIMELINGEGNK